ncbi:SDR family NAD(P)-dependent oxidoreductase [Clostridium paraputrificum]|uniref:SDR family NAD(P)-dependent oxidoreductase n=1 Tax=Clostridium TaxID=1485 RepID=UPI003D325005
MKNILITGCGSGLGRDAAIALANRGHFVYATTHTKEQADELNRLNKKWCLPIFSFKLDITSKIDILEIDSLRLDVLINNASIGDSGFVGEIDVDRYREVFETNVFSSIELTQRVLKAMISNKGGRIIFISSLAGVSSIPFLSPYCASKSALEMIGTCLNKEIKKLKGLNIPVILIEPGAYATGFNQKNLSKQFNQLNVNSYFKNHLNKLKFKQFSYFKAIESTNTNTIINMYIKAVEDKYPNDKYIAPYSQGLYIKIKKVLKK